MTPKKATGRVFRAETTLEGAGVRLKRAFGYHLVPLFDPFLLLDDFHSDDPKDYLPGFPWHPHRGIETVTYMLRGMVDHGDSLGNSGTIRPGQVQWMTAGSGIVHQEMPRGINNRLAGLQLWVNLPRHHKMIAPRYRDVQASDIPIVSPDKGVEVKIIAGRLAGERGPVQDTICEIEYFDVTLLPGAKFEHAKNPGRTVLAYVLAGAGRFDSGEPLEVAADHAVLFGDRPRAVIQAESSRLHFVLVSGDPLGEPVAWRGPIVMSTENELDQAYRELEEGTFLRQPAEHGSSG